LIALPAQINDYIFTKLGNHMKNNWKYVEFVDNDENVIVRKEIPSMNIVHSESSNNVNYSVILEYSEFSATTDPKSLKKIKIYNSAALSSEPFFVATYSYPVYFESVNDSIGFNFSINLLNSL
jgi:hypothetical protein